MKERPILFSAPMVRAVLADTKTQTRRIAKPVRHPDLGNVYSPGALALEHEPQHVIDRACPYGQPGDRLWVRETWMDLRGTGIEIRYAYCADTPRGSYGDDQRKCFGLKWRPSIHMPRSASRITLDITSVRLERLQDISEADAVAEGIEKQEDGIGWKRGPISSDHPNTATRTAFPTLAFQSLWECINGTDSWKTNPWVWAVEFKRLESTK